MTRYTYTYNNWDDDWTQRQRAEWVERQQDNLEARCAVHQSRAKNRWLRDFEVDELLNAIAKAVA